MKAKNILSLSVFISIFVFCSGVVHAQEIKPIKLMAPQLDGGKTLMQALKDRKSSREFSQKVLPLQVLSDLLWAACGINRPEIAHRTAPTAMNMQEIDVYAACADGLYLYDAKENSLIPVVSTDIRELTGKQPFVKNAPLNLVFVADLSKMSKLSNENKDFYAATDTGFISQNVYLFCASAGLATVVRGSIDKPALAKAMKLRPDQKIIMAQTVGYPQEAL
ncbi:MAG: SagB/ThcOx family dehydrogenase [Candidatus Omnitrophota bacterium]|jgi:SagB-type dehydrogenase family enzyme